MVAYMEPQKAEELSRRGAALMAAFALAEGDEAPASSH